MVERDRPTPYLSLSLWSFLTGEICFDTTQRLMVRYFL